jgi:chloride channel 3/4/5
VASGLSLGKEGPFVHIASCIGNIISRFVSKYENNEGWCQAFGCYKDLVHKNNVYIYSETTGSSQCSMRSWGCRCFWCAHRRHFVQLGRSVIFLPSEGNVEEVNWLFLTWMIWTQLLFGSFFCAMIAAITLRLLDPFGTGKLVLFQVTYDKVNMIVNIFLWSNLVNFCP